VDPLKPVEKLIEEVEIVETEKTILVSVPKGFIFWWMLALTFGGIAIAILGGWQVDQITSVLRSIETKLTPLSEWQRAADVTIRYNTQRANTIDNEHLKGVAGAPHNHEHFVVPPKSCKDARPGEPCLLD
jgi:hypothetical protein